jgi:N-carbamoylputrescine amidase
MKVTVCQIDCRPDHLDEALEGLAAHVAKEASDFLLVPEMCFSEWLAADPIPDASQWLKAVASHETHIARLSALNAKAVMGTRPIVLPHGSRRNEALFGRRRRAPFPFIKNTIFPTRKATTSIPGTSAVRAPST